VTLSKSDLWNLAHCATNRAVHRLLYGSREIAERECATAEMYQRWHSYTMADRSNPYSPS
jgi:hypothetical protein